MLERTINILREGIDEGLHLGAQICVSLHEKTIFDEGVGEVRPGVPMRSDTINHWLSSGKPITAVAIAQLWERGKLSIDDLVAQHIPEFGANGKESITIRHILTHTAGFRGIGMTWDRAIDEMLADIYAMPLEKDWKIGTAAGYHGATSWFILAEIIRRIDGRSFDRFVREEIFLPLGMIDSWIGMSPDAYHEYVAQDRIATTYDTSRARPDPTKPVPSEQACAAVNPGGNYRAPARELGRLYESLRLSRLLNAKTIHEMTSRHRVGLFDVTFQHKLDFGLGFIINSNRYGAQTVPYGYGVHASEQTFGHSGAQSSCAFCDPENGLVVAWVCNGFPGEPRHQKRQRAINEAIYADLQLC